MRLFPRIFAFLATLTLASLPVGAGDEGAREYYVKAAFLYHFVQFVEWPGDLAVPKQARINICVVGDNPFQKAKSVFQEGATERRKLALVQEPSWKGLNSGCHILFISRSESQRLPEILAATRGRPVLTVSEIDQFAARGGMIGFVTSQNKIKLVINRKAAVASGLSIDAQLLEVAESVIDK